MSKKIYCIVLLLIGNLLYSCGLNSIEYKDEFEASKIAWLNFKESSNNTYTYTVANSSWVGVSWETNISVKNGVVVQRSFEITGTEGLPADFPEHELQWNETENEIDTHDNGAEPITLDEIYTKAQQHWLVRRKIRSPLLGQRMME